MCVCVFLRACVRPSVRAPVCPCVCAHAGVAALPWELQEKEAAEAGIDQVLKRLPVRIL